MIGIGLSMTLFTTKEGSIKFQSPYSKNEFFKHSVTLH
jgi:ribosomal protein L27